MFIPCYPVSAKRCACGARGSRADDVNIRAWMRLLAMFKGHFYNTSLQRRTVLWTTPLQPWHLAALCWALGRYGHQNILRDRFELLCAEATRDGGRDATYLASELRRLMRNAYVLSEVTYVIPGAPGYTVATMRAIARHERRILLDPLRNDPSIPVAAPWAPT